MHQGTWYRHLGRLLSEVKIGIIGVGRIGKGVLRHLEGFGTTKILTNDIKPDPELERRFPIEWVDKEKIYKLVTG